MCFTQKDYRAEHTRTCSRRMYTCIKLCIVIEALPCVNYVLCLKFEGIFDCAEHTTDKKYPDSINNTEQKQGKVNQINICFLN